MSTARRLSGGRASRGGGLQLTRAADYAVRALVHLAAVPLGTRLSQVDLAAAIDAPAPFVGKVMQQLGSAGLVTSQRGKGGGFALPVSARKATMLDAITAIEGPLALNTCLSPDEPCWRASFCPAHVVWIEVQERVAGILRAATIGALADRAAATLGDAGVSAAGACRTDEAGAGAPPRLRSGPNLWVLHRGDEALSSRLREREPRGGSRRPRGTDECHR